MSVDCSEQRRLSKVDPLKLTHAIYGQTEYEQLMRDLKKLQSLSFDINIYNEDRITMLKDATRMMFNAKDRLAMNTDSQYHAGLLHFGYQMPGSMHKGVYVNGIKLLGTDQQIREMIPLCDTLEMIGCYAQTEVGHGSDVQSLETIAEFDSKTDEFIINSPTITSAKFWPGDLGIYANYAMVFARLIANGNFLGVHGFIVQIRDSKYQPLPGIEVGDIGPKYGFMTKDNGYLLLKNVRIPRKNMLRRYASLTETGELEIKGNPKIAYATMMLMRKIIAGGFYKILGQAVTIAGKYSIIRKQFKNDSGQEIKILDYQMQQNKIITCIADYYCMAINGRILSRLADHNFEIVTQKDDDSLMKETHNCMCLGKALSTDLMIKGVQICRLACGGHGFSHYSGLPGLLQENSPYPTVQGENTVLYLQLSRFLLKSHKYAVAKRGELSGSVRYLSDFDNITKSRVAVPDQGLWRLDDLSLLLKQCVCYLITTANEILAKNQGGNSKDTKNGFAALRLVQMSQVHSLLYYFDNFKGAVSEYKECGNVRKVLENLCTLFGVNALLNKSAILAQTGVIAPEIITSLMLCRERLLKDLRPEVITMIDGIGLPDSTIRSLIVKEDIYENMFNTAKAADFNKQVISAAFIIKKISEIRPKL